MDYSTAGLLSPTSSCSLPRFMSSALGMPSSRLTQRFPLSFCPQAFPASGSSLSSWLFTAVSPSGLPVSFRVDLLAVQRTVKSLLQHHSSKASVLQRSASLCSTSDNCVRLLEALMDSLPLSIYLLPNSQLFLLCPKLADFLNVAREYCAC